MNSKHRKMAYILLLLMTLVLGLKHFSPVYAEENAVETDTVFLVGSVQARAGETVRVPITVKDCVPFFGLGLEIDYDDQVLDLIGIELHEDLRPKDECDLDLPDDLSKGLLCLVNPGVGNTRFEDGPILSLTFKVPSLSRAGNYEIGLSLSFAGWVNWEAQMLTGSFISGTIGVVEAEGQPLYALIFERGEAESGTPPSVNDRFEGDTIQLPENPFWKEDFVFAGWHDGSRLYQEGDLYTMPDHAVTFTAQWQVKSPPTVPGGTATETNPTVTVTNTDTTPSTSPTSPERTSPDEKEPTSQPTTAPTVKTETVTGGEASLIHPVIDPKDMTDREISVEVIEDGIVVKGKDLSGLVFDLVKPGRKVRVDLGTEEKEILIKEVEKDIIEIFIDPDGDGHFDTSLGQVVLHADNTLLIVLVILGVLSAGLIFFLMLKRKRLKNRSDQ